MGNYKYVDMNFSLHGKATWKRKEEREYRLYNKVYFIESKDQNKMTHRGARPSALTKPYFFLDTFVIVLVSFCFSLRFPGSSRVSCFFGCLSACFSGCFTGCFIGCFTGCFTGCLTGCLAGCRPACARGPLASSIPLQLGMFSPPAAISAFRNNVVMSSSSLAAEISSDDSSSFFRSRVGTTLRRNLLVNNSEPSANSITS